MDKFLKSWLGKRVDTDGVPSRPGVYQCVDLIKRGMRDVFGVPYGAYGNAIDYWYHTHANILKKFKKVSGSAAKKGDIVVLETNKTPIRPGTGDGHVGWSTGRINSLQVEIEEQNGSKATGTGLGGDAIRTRFVDRKRVAGLLRPKPTSTSTPVYTTVKSGEGLSSIAKRSGYKDWMLPTSWIRLSQLNGKGINWLAYNRSLKTGQKVRVK